jgi:hypothetical protein
MRCHPSMLDLFTRAELTQIIGKSALTAIDNEGAVTQIILLTENLDADIYVSSQPGTPVLIHSFSEGPISRDRLLTLLQESGPVSVHNDWHAEP